MNTDYTHVSVLLDASSSMWEIKSDMIGGFNSLLFQQRQEPGKLTMTIAQFSSPDTYRVIQHFAPILEIRPLTDESYQTNGVTALLDAIARIIEDTGQALAKLPDQERPAKVLLVIITDGHENASKEETRPTIAARIKHQQEKYNWQFTYLGANQDAFTEAGGFGLHSNAATYRPTRAGTSNMFRVVTQNLSSYRNTATADASFKLSQEDLDNNA